MIAIEIAVCFGIPIVLLALWLARVADKRQEAIAKMAIQIYQRDQLIARLAHELRNKSNQNGDLAIVAEADALLSLSPSGATGREIRSSAN